MSSSGTSYSPYMAMGVELNLSDKYFDASDNEDKEKRDEKDDRMINSAVAMIANPTENGSPDDVDDDNENEQQPNADEESSERTENLPRMSTFTSIIPSGLRTVVASLNNALQPHLNNLTLFTTNITPNENKRTVYENGAEPSLPFVYLPLQTREPDDFSPESNEDNIANVPMNEAIINPTEEDEAAVDDTDNRNAEKKEELINIEQQTEEARRDNRTTTTELTQTVTTATITATAIDVETNAPVTITTNEPSSFSSSSSLPPPLTTDQGDAASTDTSLHSYPSPPYTFAKKGKITLTVDPYKGLSGSAMYKSILERFKSNENLSPTTKTVGTLPVNVPVTKSTNQRSTAQPIKVSDHAGDEEDDTQQQHTGEHQSLASSYKESIGAFTVSKPFTTSMGRPGPQPQQGIEGKDEYGTGKELSSVPSPLSSSTANRKQQAVWSTENPAQTKRMKVRAPSEEEEQAEWNEYCPSVQGTNIQPRRNQRPSPITATASTTLPNDKHPVSTTSSKDKKEHRTSGKTKETSKDALKVVSSAIEAFNQFLTTLNRPQSEPTPTEDDETEEDASSTVSRAASDASPTGSLSPILKVNESNESLKHHFRENTWFNQPSTPPAILTSTTTPMQDRPFTNLGQNMRTLVQQPYYNAPSFSFYGNHMGMYYGKNTNTEPVHHQPPQLPISSLHTPVVPTPYAAVSSSATSARRPNTKRRLSTGPSTTTITTSSSNRIKPTVDRDLNYHYNTHYNDMNNPNILNIPHTVRFFIYNNANAVIRILQQTFPLDTPLTMFQTYLYNENFDQRVNPAIQAGWHWKLTVIVDGEPLDAPEKGTLRDFITYIHRNTRSSSSSLNQAFVMHHNIVGLHVQARLEPNLK